MKPGFRKLAPVLEKTLLNLGFARQSRHSFRYGILVRFLFERDVAENVRVIRVALSSSRLGGFNTVVEAFENDYMLFAGAADFSRAVDALVTFDTLTTVFRAIRYPEEMPLLVGIPWVEKLVAEWGSA